MSDDPSKNKLPRDEACEELLLIWSSGTAVCGVSRDRFIEIFERKFALRNAAQIQTVLSSLRSMQANEPQTLYNTMLELPTEINGDTVSDETKKLVSSMILTDMDTALRSVGKKIDPPSIDNIDDNDEQEKPKPRPKKELRHLKSRKSATTKPKKKKKKKAQSTQNNSNTTQNNSKARLKNSEFWKRYIMNDEVEHVESLLARVVYRKSRFKNSVTQSLKDQKKMDISELLEDQESEEDGSSTFYVTLCKLCSGHILDATYKGWSNGYNKFNKANVIAHFKLFHLQTNEGMFV